MRTYKIHLIRHGLTRGNLEGRYIGVTDLPLCPQGRAQLEELLEQGEYPMVERVYVSPLLRARQTAQLLFPGWEPVELAGVVGEVFDRLALPLEQKGVALELELSPCPVSGDRGRLEMLVDNLAANALRHCPAGGIVTVTLAEEGDGVLLTVDNDGEPIPQADLERIWEPFYRGDGSRSRSTGGTGLGLAIVRAAAQAHGGSCTAVNRPGGVALPGWLPGLENGP